MNLDRVRSRPRGPAHRSGRPLRIQSATGMTRSDALVQPHLQNLPPCSIALSSTPISSSSSSRTCTARTCAYSPQSHIRFAMSCFTTEQIIHEQSANTHVYARMLPVPVPLLLSFRRRLRPPRLLTISLQLFAIFLAATLGPRSTNPMHVGHAGSSSAPAAARRNLYFASRKPSYAYIHFSPSAVHATSNAYVVHMHHSREPGTAGRDSNIGRSSPA